MKTNLLIFLLLASTISAQQFRWSHSKWDSPDGTFAEYDKIEHLYGGTLLYGLLYAYNRDAKQSLYSSILFAVAWEVKDAYYPFEEEGCLGGEGFCWKDLTAGICGILITHWVAIGYEKAKAMM